MTESPAKKPLALFSLKGTPRLPSNSGFPIGELRALAKEVQNAHPLKGAIKLIGDEWTVGIKCSTKQMAATLNALICFRWDGQFGSAITITAGARAIGWTARSWIWSRHPVVAELRATRTLTVVAIYNGEPISVIRSSVKDEQDSGFGFQIAVDITTEDERRPGRLLLELDEKLAYWETFDLTNTWDKLLRATDFLQIGWCREFQIGLLGIALEIKDGIAVPDLDDGSRRHWKEGELECPQEFWDSTILPLTEALRGHSSILQFVRVNRANNILLVIADHGEEQLKRNPLHELRWIVARLAECSLLADTQTGFGKKVVFSTLDGRHNAAVEIPTKQLDIDDAKKYWENLPGVTALNIGDLVNTSMQPADLGSIIDQIKAIRLGCDQLEAETAIATMTEEANILNRWTIPWGARVQSNIGPFTEIDFFSYGDEISIILKTPNQHYRWAAFNLRTAVWNFHHLLQNRFDTFGEDTKEEHLAEEIELAFKLILTSIVRDFVVLEERESAFAIRRDITPHGRSMDDGSPRIVYIPRIRYVKAPDTKGLEKGLEYESRRPHHVRAHQRRANAGSPFQRILAERYGFRLEPGFTFVRPHQRGGIAPDREIIYRSRSAMQSLYGVESSIESNGTSNWFQFERDVHNAMMQAGFKVDHVASARNGDAGIDIFAESTVGNEFWAIQCKCYAPKRKIGPAIVRELIGALASYPSGTRGMIVATSGYSSGAIELANQFGIDLRLLMLDTNHQDRKNLIEVSKLH